MSKKMEKVECPVCAMKFDSTWVLANHLLRGMNNCFPERSTETIPHKIYCWCGGRISNQSDKAIELLAKHLADSGGAAVHYADCMMGKTESEEGFVEYSSWKWRPLL